MSKVTILIVSLEKMHDLLERYAISLPIIIPLAQEMDVNIWLAIGSVISAGAFGSHACFIW